MNRRLVSSLVLLALFVAGLPLAGCESQIEQPQELTLQARNATDVLPAGARFVAMIDVAALQHQPALAPFGDGMFALNNANDEASARIQDLLAATGFDPEMDLQEIYVAVTETGSREQPSLVAYATLDNERLHQYFQETMADKVATADYQGITVYRARQEAPGLVFAVPSENMIVASPDAEAVHAMIDRLGGQRGSLSQDAEALALIARAASASDAWFVARNLDDHTAHAAHSDDPLARDAQQIGSAVRDVAIAFTATDDGLEGTAYLHTKEGVSSKDVADLTKGFVAALKAQPDIDARTLRMLDEVRVRSQDDQVHVQFFVDNATLRSDH